MKTLLSLLTSVVLSCGILQASEIADLTAGKYLVLITDADDEDAGDEMLMELTKEGVLLILSANEEATALPYARLSEGSSGEIYVEFSPLFEEMSGDFTVKRLAEKRVKLSGESGTLLFKPFHTDVDRNKAMGITGAWKMDKEGVKLILDFRLPDVVYIEYSKDYETTKVDSFWFAEEDAKAITITTPLFFDQLVGTLSNIRVEANMLSFEHKGILYKMQKVE